MKKRFSEEQIIKILREHETGVSVSELARKYGFTEPTFYRWRKKFGGMDVSEAKKLRSLEKENSELKKLLAEQMLDNKALKYLLEKKW